MQGHYYIADWLSDPSRLCAFCIKTRGRVMSLLRKAGDQTRPERENLYNNNSGKVYQLWRADAPHAILKAAPRHRVKVCCYSNLSLFLSGSCSLPVPRARNDLHDVAICMPSRASERDLPFCTTTTDDRLGRLHSRTAPMINKALEVVQKFSDKSPPPAPSKQIRFESTSPARRLFVFCFFAPTSYIWMGSSSREERL
jgi:hypothetical protein